MQNIYSTLLLVDLNTRFAVARNSLARMDPSFHPYHNTCLNFANVTNFCQAFLSFFSAAFSLKINRGKHIPGSIKDQYAQQTHTDAHTHTN